MQKALGGGAQRAMEGEQSEVRDAVTDELT